MTGDQRVAFEDGAHEQKWEYKSKSNGRILQNFTKATLKSNFTFTKEIMRGFDLITKNKCGGFHFEFDGKLIQSSMYRAENNGAQQALSIILKSISMEQPLDFEKISYLADKIDDKHKDEEFSMEYGMSGVKAWLKVFILEKEELYENIETRKDIKFLRKRYGFEKTLQDIGLQYDEFLDQNYPVKEVTYDLVNELERSENNNFQVDFFDGDIVIAKSFKLKSSISCWGQETKREDIMVYIQLIINDSAMNLADLDDKKLKNFISKHLKEVEFPFHLGPFWKEGATMYQELSDAKLDTMTKNLRDAKILDRHTEVAKGWILMPNFVTKAVKNGLVKWEFGVQLHIGPKREQEFEFFIQ